MMWPFRRGKVETVTAVSAEEYERTVAQAVADRLQRERIRADSRGMLADLGVPPPPGPELVDRALYIRIRRLEQALTEKGVL